MTLRVCLDCSCAYAVGVGNCPHCGSERSREQGEETVPAASIRHIEEDSDVPKITRHGGPSFAGQESLGSVPDDAVLDQPHLPKGVRHPDDGSTKTEAENGDATPDSGQGSETVAADQGDPGEVPQEDQPPAAPTPERPAVRDAKAAWVDYAVTLGLTKEAAELVSKDDLIALVRVVEDGTHRVTEDGTVVPVDEDSPDGG